jgi:hypothetical protein
MCDITTCLYNSRLVHLPVDLLSILSDWLTLSLTALLTFSFKPALPLGGVTDRIKLC